MKIDFSIDKLSGGGAERVMVTLANGLSERHEVRLITFTPEDKYEVSSNVKRVKLNHKSFKNHTLKSINNLIKFYQQGHKPDILITFMPYNALIALVVGLILRIDVIVSEHINHTFNKKTKKDLFIQKRFYRYAKHLTVLTKYDIEYFKNMKANVSVMPNPINIPNDINPFQNRKKQILLVGSLNRIHQKGFDAFLPVIAPILKKHEDWKLKILGSGDEGMVLLKRIASELEITNQVIFAGFCSNIEQEMQSSQIFVLPSRHEGLPMGLMEALSNGMACIAYDCISGPRELIDHEKNGLLIENQNCEQMSFELNRLIEDSYLREALAKNSAESVKKYSLDVILSKWENLFNS